MTRAWKNKSAYEVIRRTLRVNQRTFERERKYNYKDIQNMSKRKKILK